VAKGKDNNAKANEFIRRGFGGLTAGGAGLAKRLRDRMQQIADESPDERARRIEQQRREDEARRGVL
jgi:hypothetical protein